LPKESPWQAAGGLKSLEGTDRNVSASRAWKGGNMKLDFGNTVFVTVLFYPLSHLSSLRHSAYRASPVCSGFRDHLEMRPAGVSMQGGREQIMCINFAALLLE